MYHLCAVRIPLMFHVRREYEETVLGYKVMSVKCGGVVTGDWQATVYTVIHVEMGRRRKSSFFQGGSNWGGNKQTTMQDQVETAPCPTGIYPNLTV